MRAAVGDLPRQLRAMIRQVQWEVDGLPAPGRVTLIGTGVGLAVSGTAVYAMRARGVDATRVDAGELAGCRVPGAVVGVCGFGCDQEVVAALRRVGSERSLLVTAQGECSARPVVDGCVDVGVQADSRVPVVATSGTLLALGMLTDVWLGRADAERWVGAIDAAAVAAMESPAIAGAFAEVATGLAGASAIDLVAAPALVTLGELGALLIRSAVRVPATGMSTRYYTCGAGGGAEASGTTRTGYVVIGGREEAVLADELAASGRRVVFLAPSTLETMPMHATVIEIPVPMSKPVEFVLAGLSLVQRLALLAGERRGVDVDAPVTYHGTLAEEAW